MKFDSRPKVRLVRERLQAAMQEAAEELGISVEIGGGSYRDNHCTFKLECSSVNEDGTVHNQDEEDFKLNCALYGLKPEAFGAKFKLRGKTYTITGLKTRRHKYPISGERSDGKPFKFPVIDVKRGLVDQSLVTSQPHSPLQTW